MKGQPTAIIRIFSIVSLPNWRIFIIRFGTREKRLLSFARWGNKRKRHGCCGSLEVWSTGVERAKVCTSQTNLRRGVKKHVIYVRAKYENDPTDLDEWDETLDEYLCKVRHNKAKNLMMPYLARTIMEWRDGRTLYYSGLLTAMNTELMVILDFIKYGRTHADHRRTIIDLEEAIRLLHEAQTRIGQNDEKEAWIALFTHIWERHPWWYD